MLDQAFSLSFIFKKTNDLSANEINQLLFLHNDTMDKKRNIEEFKQKYLYNFLGFSFHGLMINNNKIVGCYTVIPQKFTFFSKKMIFGQWCENLIDKKFRGSFTNFKKLGNIVNSKLVDYDICFVYGLPNRSLYVVSKRLLKMKDIGKLNYYVYPNNLNKFLVKYYPFNIIICFLLKILSKIRKRNYKIINYNIFKEYNKKFHFSRYGSSDFYKVLDINDIKIIYKIERNQNHNNAKIIWIMDVLPLSSINIENSVNKLKNIYTDIDLIVYVGVLKTIPINLFKVPDKFFKEQSIFSGKILDSQKIGDIIFDLSNWNVNSSNFDHK